MTKTFWITDSRFKFIAVLLLIIFLVFMAFLFIEGEAIKKDPCNICAEKQGTNVICSLVGSFQPITRTYLPDGSMKDVRT